jgi:nickel transport protein
MTAMKWKYWLPLTALSVFGWQLPGFTHGVNINYEPASALQVTATYDNGDPMAEAQVVVYAPENPAEPWMTGTTNQAGQFTFTPDPAQPGNWEVQVRQAGHGDIVSIPLQAATTAASTDSSSDASTAGTTTATEPAIQVADTVAKQTGQNFTAPQIVLMGAAGIWGFVGTALFFSRENK